MVDIQNTMPIDDDEQEYRVRSKGLKFTNILLQGIGGAMVFGLIGAVAKGLFDVAGKLLFNSAGHFVAANLGAAMLPCLGLAAIAVVGVACIYFGAQYFSQSVALDQEHQAMQIALAKDKCKTPTLEVAQEQAQPTPVIPAQMDKDKENASRGDAKEWNWISKTPTATPITPFYSDKPPEEEKPAPGTIDTTTPASGKTWVETTGASPSRATAALAEKKPDASWVAKAGAEKDSSATMLAH